MATYTGVADANGDFIVPFSASYTSGQKVTVTAEKEGATKSIELFAPSNITGGGVIQIDGSFVDFPLNITDVTLTEQISGTIQRYAFRPHSDTQSRSIWRYAKSLKILGNVTRINSYAFYGWDDALSLQLPQSLQVIEENAFNGWRSALELTIPNQVTSIPRDCFYGWNSAKSLYLHAGIASIGERAFYEWLSCDEIICMAVAPPTIISSSFSNLKSTCIIKVPAASVAAYQSAPNWSAFASRIQAI
ncbi:leucine-rich repeat domain-containing protein [Acinetobacter sp. YH12069]|uniref:leucine-rich repeat domain-containing protein n=1 Tax=Acinetobacter sp. YH12069 TaxID=2601065 RepID=UPI0015D2E3EC|nr:leucine-rich repeat domain-containing protein [Acinetobacter sp. YH12069]